MQRQQTSAVGFEGGPHDQDFKQQKLEPVCSPILTSDVLRNVLVVVGICFIILGSVLLSYSNGIVEQKTRYDNVAECQVTSDTDSATLPKKCELTLTIENDMELPVYFYYELNGFYQNHRKFIQSYSAYQLEDGELHDTDGCDPLQKYDGKPIYPCGLIANSFFSDRFTMSVNDDDLCSACDITETDWLNNWDTWFDNDFFKKEGIAWTVDREDRFNFQEPDATVTRQGERQVAEGLNLPRVDDEDYMVWARTSALPNFRKLYRKIEKLPSGKKKLVKGNTVKINIMNWFNVKDFDGQKHVVLATVSWFGGKCSFLALAYLIIGCVSIVGALFLAVCKPERKLGNFEEFEWKNREPQK